MPKIVSIFFIVILLFTASSLFILFSKTTKAQENLLVSPVASDNKKAAIKLEPILKSKINILLLGLDGRKGDSRPRCDAIHVITYNPTDDTMTITSVPRGTEVRISKDEVNSISNYCHYFGTEAAAKQIEKITGLAVDYTIKLGFSQTLGILRTLNMPVSSTLLHLRNRTTPYGDYQRSRNQAVFIKDMIVDDLDKVSSVPQLLQYLIYKMIDTDMPFDVARQLLDKINGSQIGGNPASVQLTSKPDNFLKLKEVHFQETDENRKSDKEFKEYQDNLNVYLKNLLAQVDAQIKNGNNMKAFSLLKTPFSQQIWLQMENEKLRNEYHFAFLKDFAQTSPDNEKVPSYISDFIEEMEGSGQNELKTKAENLLKGVI